MLELLASIVILVLILIILEQRLRIANLNRVLKGRDYSVMQLTKSRDMWRGKALYYRTGVKGIHRRRDEL